MEEVKNVLKDIFLFNGAAEVVDKEEFSAPKTFLKGQVIYSADTFLKSIGVIIDGKAKATALSGEALLTRFGVGDVFGAAAVFGNNKEYISKIVADSDCTVQFIEQEKLLLLFEKYPVISINYVTFLSSRIRFLNEKLAIMMQDDVESRIYAYLLKNDGYSGKMTTLANTLCIGRTSLYRSLEALENKNLIVKKDGKFKVVL